MIVLYSTNCPKCKVLKAKMNEIGIEFTENNSVEDMLTLGIRQVPVLSYNGDLMNFNQAIQWIQNYTKED